MPFVRGRTYDRVPPSGVNFSQSEGIQNAHGRSARLHDGEAGMKVQLHDNKNFLSGLFFIGVGGLGIFMAQDYPMGTALRMGPGYFPIVLSGLLILFGIYCLVQGLLKPEKLPGNWSPRALLILPLATVVFGVLMEHAGFIPALI